MLWKEKMRGQLNRTTAVILALIGAAGLILFLCLWRTAFPEAGVEVNLTEKDARETAEAFLRSNGHDPRGYDSTMVFGVVQTTAAYLERTLDSEAVRQVMREDVTVWQWLGRWFRPQQVEEFRVNLDPATGHLVSFQHIVPQDAFGADITEEQAMRLAVRFLESQGVNLNDYELMAQSSETLSARTDYHFAWHRRQYRVADATCKVEVTIQGDQVGGYSRHLVIPESFTRSFANEQESGLLLSMVGFFLLFILIVATLILAAKLFRQDALPWRFGLPFSIGLVITSVLGAVNKIPLRWYEYPTQVDKVIHLSLPLVAAAVIGTIFGFSNLIGAAVGHAVRQDVFDYSPLSGRGDTRDGSLLDRLRRASLPGYALASAYLGFMTVFYLLGRRFLGVWLPTQAGPAATLSTLLPVAAPLVAALHATLLEEVGFRLFCIPVFKKYLRSTFVAVTLSAIIWSLLHSSHMVYPVYVRIVEITIVGIAFGYFFLHFGLTAVMIAHFTVDVVLLSLPLLTSSHPYYLGSGIADLGVAALPLVVSLCALSRSKSRTQRTRTPS